MKKLILLAVFAVLTGVTFAQVSFGVHAGPNFAFGKIKSEQSSGYTTTYTNSLKVGFVAGLVAEIPLGGDMLAFRPELNFTQKGSKNKIVYNYDNPLFDDEIEEHNLTLNYVELPLNFVYKIPVGEGSFFMGLGPTVAFGLSGKDKVSYPDFPEDNKNYDVSFDGKKFAELPSSDEDTHFDRVDFGANALVGYKLPMGLFGKLGYTYNFKNINPNDDEPEKPSYKNKGFNITVGMMFGGKKAKSSTTAPTN